MKHPSIIKTAALISLLSIGFSCNRQTHDESSKDNTSSKGFNGVINLDVRESTPDWKPFERKKAPVGSPNVLIVLYDDTGLGAWSPGCR